MNSFMPIKTIDTQFYRFCFVEQLNLEFIFPAVYSEHTIVVSIYVVADFLMRMFFTKFIWLSLISIFESPFWTGWRYLK